MNKNVLISIKVSLNFIPKGAINDIPALEEEELIDEMKHFHLPGVLSLCLFETNLTNKSDKSSQPVQAWAKWTEFVDDNFKDLLKN